VIPALRDTVKATVRARVAEERDLAALMELLKMSGVRAFELRDSATIALVRNRLEQLSDRHLDWVVGAASAASSNVCPGDDPAESFVVGVVVAPDDVAADHAALFVVAGVVGAVEGEVPQRGELRLHAV